MAFKAFLSNSDIKQIPVMREINTQLNDDVLSRDAVLSELVLQISVEKRRKLPSSRRIGYT